MAIDSALTGDVEGKTGVLGRWWIVAMLWVAYFLNHSDRQVFNVNVPLIQADFGLSSGQIGFVATLFTIVFGLTIPFAGLAGDLFDRRRLVIISLLVFSGGTVLSGVAMSYVMFLLVRGVATGSGEALYAPAANTLIREQHAKSAGRALSIHQTANYTGVMLGSLFAGWMGEHYGWRTAFLVFGFSGLVWTVVMMLGTRSTARSTTRVKAPSRAEYAALLSEAAVLILRSPLLIAQVIGFSGFIFMLTGYLTWMPTLLHERFGLSMAQAGFYSVFHHHLFGYIGLLAAGFATDRLIGRFPRVRLLSMAVGLALCGPFLLLCAGAGSLTLMYFGLAGFGLFRGIYDASLYAAIYDIVEDRLRATVSGSMIAVSYVVGAGSPLILGAMKDAYGLGTGVVTLAAAASIVGLIFAALVAANPLYRTSELVSSATKDPIDD